MTDLLLIFLGTACASELLLCFAVDGRHGRLSVGRLATLGLSGCVLAGLWLVQRLPSTQASVAVAGDFLRGLALAFTAWALAQGRAAISPQDARVVRFLRAVVPLLSANVVVTVLTLAGLVPFTSLAAVVLLCVGCSALLHIATLAYPALRERIVFADLPAAWRGAPIAAMTLCIIALAWTGLARTLPW